ncbi:MAG TPA: DUF6263 family protein [Chitinophagaceae bacterium]|nr:DUF6263 family protein [Chitinophagaceae bacterium]
MLKKLRKAFVCFLLFVQVISCKNDQQNKIHSADEKKYRLKGQLPANAKYYFTIANETHIKLELEGKESGNINKSTVGLIYSVSKDSAGNFLLTVTYDSLHVYSKNNDTEIDVDAANAAGSADPVEKLLGSIKGAALFVSMDKKGNIIGTKGYKELADKVLLSITATDDYTRKMMQNTLSKFIGEDFVKNNVTQMVNLFPDSAVYVGDSWTKSGNPSADIKIDMLTRYTLVALNNNIAEINAVSDIKNAADKPTEIMGYNIAVDLKGKDESNFTTDINTGITLKANSNTSIKGTVQMLGRDVPITITTKKEIKTRKLL